MFHGSQSKFDSFSLDFVGKNGTTEGYGIYFTDNKTIAENYAHNGWLYSVELNIKDTLKDDVQELTAADIRNIIKLIDSDGSGFLSNYGEVAYTNGGYTSLLITAANECLSFCDTDVDIIGSIHNAGVDLKSLLLAVTETTNKNCIISSADWVKAENDEKIIIMFHNDDIKIKQCLNMHN